MDPAATPVTSSNFPALITAIGGIIGTLGSLAIAFLQLRHKTAEAVTSSATPVAKADQSQPESEQRQAKDIESKPHRKRIRWLLIIAAFFALVLITGLGLWIQQAKRAQEELQTARLTFFRRAASGRTVIIVRYAEKVVSTDTDPSLSPGGRRRAEALARILKDSGITTIFTSEFKRTQETAGPTATSIGIAPSIVPARDTDALVAKLQHLNGNALVVGHTDTIPSLIEALGVETSVEIPSEDYSELFIVTLGDKPRLIRLHYL
jgi:phosphohistidine phosphatase SixA